MSTNVSLPGVSVIKDINKIVNKVVKKMPKEKKDTKDKVIILKACLWTFILTGLFMVVSSFIQAKKNLDNKVDINEVFCMVRICMNILTCFCF